MLTTKQPPKRVRIETTRPWVQVEQEVENGEIVGIKSHRTVVIGEVVEVDRVLGAELVASGKAVPTEAPVGKPGKAAAKATPKDAG